MLDREEALTMMFRRLERHRPLGAWDRKAVMGLPVLPKVLEAGNYLIREGETPSQVCILVSGFLYGHKMTGNGLRQIVSIHMQGDVLDLQTILAGPADHNVQALTRSELALIPWRAIEEAGLARPGLWAAMWAEALVEAAILREWVLNIGRRDALGRIAHLICELAVRLEGAGLGEGLSQSVPLTQEQLADAVGLTSVHVNRILQQMKSEGLIRREKRLVIIEDWKRMRSIADFNPSYLHRRQRALEPA